MPYRSGWVPLRCIVLNPSMIFQCVFNRGFSKGIFNLLFQLILPLFCFIHWFKNLLNWTTWVLNRGGSRHFERGAQTKKWPRKIKRGGGGTSQKCLITNQKLNKKLSQRGGGAPAPLLNLPLLNIPFRGYCTTTSASTACTGSGNAIITSNIIINNIIHKIIRGSVPPTGRHFLFFVDRGFFFRVLIINQ